MSSVEEAYLSRRQTERFWLSLSITLSALIQRTRAPGFHLLQEQHEVVEAAEQAANQRRDRWGGALLLEKEEWLKECARAVGEIGKWVADREHEPLGHDWASTAGIISTAYHNRGPNTPLYHQHVQAIMREVSSWRKNPPQLMIILVIARALERAPGRLPDLEDLKFLARVWGLHQADEHTNHSLAHMSARQADIYFPRRRTAGRTW